MMKKASFVHAVTATAWSVARQEELRGYPRTRAFVAQLVGRLGAVMEREGANKYEREMLQALSALLAQEQGDARRGAA